MTPEIFKASREKIELTQTELAKKLGLSLRQIQNLEAGKNPIKKLHEFALRWIAKTEYKTELKYEYQKEIKL